MNGPEERIIFNLWLRGKGYRKEQLAHMRGRGFDPCYFWQFFVHEKLQYLYYLYSFC